MTGSEERLYGQSGARQLDRVATSRYGLGSGELMGRAGAAAFRVLRRRWPEAMSIMIVCGPGNNGGDGYVIGRLAHSSGLKTIIVAVAAPATDEALQARDQAEQAGVCIEQFSGGELPDADLLIDCILGTGMKRPPAGDIATTIEALNRLDRPVMAVDMPSGLEADSGAAPGKVVHAELTVTFIGLKLGLYTGRGPDVSGEIVYESISVPQDVHQAVLPLARLITGKSVVASLPPRRKTIHKGESGQLLIVGGDAGMSGAVRLAGEAALRSGAGLVTVATRNAHAAVINSTRPELMCHGVEDEFGIESALEGKDCVVIGPGLGTGEWGRMLLNSVINSGLTLVIDADGLNMIAGSQVSVPQSILTPHPGEAARLLGCDPDEIQARRDISARRIQDLYGGVCMLKGPGTLICLNGGELWLCDRGNPGMATAGMGDVLSGVIGGLLAQGLSVESAAKSGAWLHSAAADLAVLAGGERGLLASDLAPWLRRLVNNPLQADE